LELVEDLSRNNWYRRVGKPVSDRILGLLLALLFLVPMVLLALFVLVYVGRPVIYRQERIGYGGKPFTLYKFRTMAHDRRTSEVPFVGPERRMIHKSDTDPRVGRAGAFLRKWSLDEIPQFLNVLKGEMSLVGPRPEMTKIVTGYEPWQHKRHQVKPGLTGLWQISNRSTLMRDCTELDIDYVDRCSAGLDLRILLATPLAVFGRSRGI